MGAEQRQQQRDFFLRTDLDHDCSLRFATLVGAGGRRVQDDLVSALFQPCFVSALHRAFGRLVCTIER
ncbi:hypothetical protein DCG74_31530 [Bradyrhizobium sp. WBAH42]|nr:hypothetical protein [Bradyrhizobium sp. WBAH30]MDD1542317.1 hypothetical protein [Bradyrhizobium sp. WBAH41]MDD1556469.1 hypothetical protein [Bradyrhizobium sp. WBAH23]MDD1561690.1 hypothetical protein [Bradyrhizobium sp. WBAH33]MDD1589288.1 hypothetical protein [Bradyrhizobium sp. WBAH42]NRB87785.1 hypothetical protein [Bradyrhizobium sp. WBAH10]QCJ92598.1 hypothetical protein DAA57_31970 [Bradyrhizobium yuanmingense]